MIYCKPIGHTLCMHFNVKFEIENLQFLNCRSYQKSIVLNHMSTTAPVVKEFVLELLKYQDKRDIYDQLLRWSIPRMPVGGKQLNEHGVPPGRKMGFITQKLKEIWCAHRFNIDAEQLLTHLPDVLNEYEEMRATAPPSPNQMKRKKK